MDNLKGFHKKDPKVWVVNHNYELRKKSHEVFNKSNIKWNLIVIYNGTTNR